MNDWLTVLIGLGALGVGLIIGWCSDQLFGEAAVYRRIRRR